MNDHSRSVHGIGMTSARTRARMIDRLVEQGIQNAKVLACFELVPRHLFVDEALGHKAYEDISVPIGYAQTLSQPYIVAKMSELVLQAPHHERVLEIGTGSGFQTCVLANLVDEVYSVERIAPLQQKAKSRLQQLNLKNVQLKMDDGFFGWPEEGPFDVIIGTAAPSEPPMELLDQLIPDGGRLIMPIGEEQQYLTVIDKVDDQITKTQIEPVVFVPMLSGVKNA
ncbi:protein-L-isoaspartate(D-aspartate) O-methyltransferase [Reinekea thalattae]|uniref:Protein-L-isoaspartate O-methyltransferase n=1 Tax=Reinekea thalattae TaxID=2593301 RepID=A0A5C8ZB87_9GAMM|nr:protein-L-isoaspartate(D-aspartate) O-methyltransferase [Reinekea thalattae]TXR54060.1 protein-L-isoaspartate(D-aspartate) O-methyltransferase [Reinekea thalattae]